MDYIKLTLKVGLSSFYRLYLQPSVKFEIQKLWKCLNRNDVLIYVVESADFIDMDDNLEIIINDESGCYFW